ncbi:MAG: hypothetical protein GY859_15685 [Desulfobacterales bacterium]|nr:hypothetical protein [Desulfobacterales bacterium]
MIISTLNPTREVSMSGVKVLFIGNSHTYLHYMPEMVERLAEAGGDELTVRQVTGEGVGLKWHEANQETKEAIHSEKWSHVVLQDRSGGPLEEREAMFHYARLLDGEIKKRGAKTVFFMTWANREKPETQAILAEAYTRIARELGAMAAPVGLAWEAAMKKNPGLRLHHEDGRHANPTGAYLAACVFYAILLNKSPEGLPGTLHAGGKNRGALTAATAALLQKIAYKSLAEKLSSTNFGFS